MVMSLYNLTIYSKDGEIAISVKENENLLDAIRRSGLYLDSPCGGRGTCGKCLVKVKGSLSSMEKKEEDFIKTAGLDIKNHRLACFTHIKGDCEAFLNEEYQIEVEKSFLGNKPEQESIYSGDSVGVAVDIGTTTVAVSLYDLKSKMQLSSGGFINPQRPYGADVVSRIGHIREEGVLLHKLKSLIIEGMNGCVFDLCKKANVPIDKISQYVISGNTAMECIAAGINTDSLGEIPYSAPDYMGRNYVAEEIGLAGGDGASAYLMPCIAGYVGGDITSGIIACGVDSAEHLTILIDVGTNGEMAIKTNEGIFCCATAAGPCFEGANIALGMGASEGAISRVWLSDGKICVDTIGKSKPSGICGSGLIDAVSVFLTLGLIDETGRIDDEIDSEYICEKDGEVCLILCSEVWLTQKDIRQVQLAKAAVNAGIRTLCLRSGARLGDIGKVYLAGGFGNHIRIESALKIGLLPDELKGKIVSVGNSSLKGSELVLLSETVSERAKSLAEKSLYIELSTDPDFSEEYINQMLF